MRPLAAVSILTLAVGVLHAAPQVLKEWKFDTPGDAEGWEKANHIKDVKVSDGLLQGTVVDWDPFLIGPQFEIPATPWQVVEVRLKTGLGGGGEIFWTNTTETKYGGFSPGKETHFEIIGDNEWHEYRIYPYWQGEGKIVLLRLDLPRGSPDQPAPFAVDWIRIVDFGAAAPVNVTQWNLSAGAQGWASRGQGSLQPVAGGLQFSAGAGSLQLVSPPLAVPVGEKWYVHFRMTASGAQAGSVIWASDKASGMLRQAFALRADGRPHVYNLDLSGQAGWTSTCLLLGLALPPGATGTLHAAALSDEPMGEADVEVAGFFAEDALNRAGRDCPLLLTLRNHGGAPAKGVRLAKLELPPGVRLMGTGKALSVPEIPPEETLRHRLIVKAAAPAKGDVRLKLQGPGTTADWATASLRIGPALNLPKATFVPEPRPVKCDYEIGAYYFPGWGTSSRWQCIRDIAPERKPVLGWYDEANPECADWQIKWAVENGISYFMVDWYWSAGGRHLEHWLHDAYMKSKWRKHLKWCMMWANHIAPNTHSEADQRAVTQYWLDHYFAMPEYYRINDMPVVIIWAPGNMRRDMGGNAGARKLLDISQQMARAAGYKGIYFMAMCGPDAGAVKLLKDEGYSETTSYHYMGHGGRATDPMRYPFELVAETSRQHWQSYLDVDILPFLPNLSTGWDSRPWHGDKGVVITGRTVPLFRKICEDARKFADQHGIKRLALGPLNEWGEGSYIEPCAEFGFEMYEVVRDVFCGEPGGAALQQPAQNGWPLNYGPRDVGLGPYDFDMDLKPRTSWDFADGPQGWGPMMGVGDFKAEGGVLSFTSASRDPALSATLPGFRAGKFSRFVLRMRTEGLAAGDSAQLFWDLGTGCSEAASVRAPLLLDGQWHDYVFDLAAHPRWRGKVKSLRLDPCSTQGMRVAIEEMRLE